MLEAIAFLTRVPVPQRFLRGEPGRAVPWFGVIGAFVGAVGTVSWWAGSLLSPGIGAVAAVTTTILLTGAFHEDGLADTFDAMGARSDEDVTRVMKDSRLGTFGGAALIATFLGRVLLLSELDVMSAPWALVAAHAGARSVTMLAMTRSQPGPRGLGSSHLSGLSVPAVTVGSIGVLALVGYGAGVDVVLSGVAAGLVGAWLLVRWATRRTGGVPGDVLGAVEQVAEIAFLTGAVALGS